MKKKQEPEELGEVLFEHFVYPPLMSRWTVLGPPILSAMLGFSIAIDLMLAPQTPLWLVIGEVVFLGTTLVMLIRTHAIALHSERKMLLTRTTVAMAATKTTVADIRNFCYRAAERVREKEAAESEDDG